jgi:hypothetical protein
MNISILNRPSRPAEQKPLDEPLPFTAGVAAGVAAQVKERLWQRMVRECEAMGHLWGQSVPTGRHG